MGSQQHVVVVEDEAATRALLVGHFANEGYRVSAVACGQELDRVLSAERADLISLDIRLPGEDGIAVLRRLRASDACPIIVVSAQNDAAERVAALELGADDYVAKPFDERELLARARNLLRRAQPAPRTEPPLEATFHGWRLHRDSRDVFDPEGNRVQLTRGEFDLLLTLVDNLDRVLPRRELIKALGHRSVSPTERTVDVMIGRLRRKIEPDPAHPRCIVTHHGVGYVLRSR